MAHSVFKDYRLGPGSPTNSTSRWSRTMTTTEKGIEEIVHINPGMRGVRPTMS